MSGLTLNGQIAQAQKTEWFTVLAQELQTDVDRTSGAFYHPDADGLMLKVVVANEAGAFSATVNLQTVDEDGNWFTIYTSAAITTNSTTLILISENSATNTLWTIVNFPLPRTWRIFLDYTGTPATDMADTKISAAYI